ncbi:MAG: protein kinase [Candidatus Aminicenantes bacterium]|nr:MAG: protein kinase [Candidatus Aminicenantes bacterium]
MIGKTISHYKILDKLGEGGMGVVYKAEDTKLKRTVALKFLPQELTRDKEAKERFFQEAQAAAALDHPNICTVHEIDEAEGKTFIAMAYIKGESLKEKIASGTMKIDKALDIAIQIAEGLGEAHEKGIIHRDIKPANVLLTEKAQAKITDFGLAKLTWGVDLTKTATIMGTASYMSPEQAKGEKVDHRTDIWSLGAMLYEILTGKLPFKSRRDQAVIYSIINEDPEPITNIRKDIPKKLERIVQRSLEKDQQNRYRDMGALLAELKSINLKPKSISFADKPSIAVLPFVNMSADPENEYFSDGLAEELINALTKIQDLHVVARTSSFAFKGEKADIREIGQGLNVKTLLEGSVRKAGNRVRITAQLVKVEDGYHLWSERYDRNMEDVFAIQDEITEKIMDKLMAALEVRKKPPEEHRPANLEAYDLYLKGRYYWYKLSIDKAITYYKQAIDKDPDYALAYAAIAEAYTMLSIGFDILPSKDAMPKAREAAQKALELDPTLAEAYGSLGLVALSYDWDHSSAKKYFQKALKLNPNSAIVHQWVEIYWTYIEANIEEATAHLERAQELDPLNLMIKVRLGFMSLFLRDWDRAADQFKEIIDFEPNYVLGHLGLLTVYGWKGMYDEALAPGEKMLELGPPTVAYIGNMGYISAKQGNKNKAYEFLAELEERSKKGYVSSFWVAVIYLGLDEKDKTFEWFDKAYEERDSNLIYVTVPPPFDPLRSDPRYKKLLKKMGLEYLLEKLKSLAKP